jgi:hypothetical protein
MADQYSVGYNSPTIINLLNDELERLHKLIGTKQDAYAKKQIAMVLKFLMTMSAE